MHRETSKFKQPVLTLFHYFLPGITDNKIIYITPKMILYEDIVAIGNPYRHMRKASHCGSKQQ